jgi:hypothetical protein
LGPGSEFIVVSKEQFHCHGHSCNITNSSPFAGFASLFALSGMGGILYTLLSFLPTLFLTRFLAIKYLCFLRFDYCLRRKLYPPWFSRSNRGFRGFRRWMAVIFVVGFSSYSLLRLLWWNGLDYYRGGRLFFRPNSYLRDWDWVRSIWFSNALNATFLCCNRLECLGKDFTDC